MRAQGTAGYDMPTAVTFFLAGLGIGTVLTLVFLPRAQQDAPSAPAIAANIR